MKFNLKTLTQTQKEEIKAKFAAGASLRGLAREYNTTYHATEKLCKGGDVVAASASVEVEEDIETLIDRDTKLIAARRGKDVAEKKYKHLLAENGKLQDKIAELVDVRQSAYSATPVSIPSPKVNKSKNEACAIACFSDFHVGEYIDPATVNGLNEYNPTIAEKRAKLAFVNLLKLVEVNRFASNVETLVLHLGGDFITGHIHDDQRESNTMSPVKEVTFATRLLKGGIKYLLDNGNFKRIICVCSKGNHARTTKERRVSTYADTSFESIIYASLEDEFANSKVVEFINQPSYFTYLNIFGKVIRFSHGDNVRYGGGIGGLTIPLLKFIANANRQRTADLDVLGHFHQLMHGTNFSVNGSLMGFNAYALSIGASPEPPQQMFRLLDSKRGLTVTAPIFVTDETERYTVQVSHAA